MDRNFIVIHALLLSLVLRAVTYRVEGLEVSRLCDSPQFAEIRRSGTIRCTFKEGFFGVYWYNTSDYVNHSPIIQYENHFKSGTSFNSGEFDISSNGSLIIKDVLLSHERNYTVIYVESRKKDALISLVQLIVLVKPQISFPYIRDCGNQSHFCYSEIDGPLECSIADVRPDVHLKWTARTLDGDKDMLAVNEITSNSKGYTSSSIVSASNAFHFSPLLVLLVCKAVTPTIMLDKTESMILAQNKGHTSNNVPIFRYADSNSTIKLDCTDTLVAFVVWKKLKFEKDAVSDIILYASYIGVQFTKVNIDGFSEDGQGSLVMHDVSVTDSGTYMCVFGDGSTDGSTVYDITITVTPVPPHPIVDGCKNQNYCILEVNPEGILKCSMRNSRPQVMLEWRTFYEDESDLLALGNQHLATKEANGLFDVSLTLSYSLKDKSRERLKLECRVPESQKIFHSSTTVYLIFVKRLNQTDPPVLQFTLKSAAWSYILIGTLIAVILVFAVVLFVSKLCYRKFRVGNSQEVRSLDEGVSMRLINQVRDEKRLGAKRNFVKEIKETYKDLFDAVQPIPYIKDRLYCVDKVFVEGGLEFLDQMEGTRPQRIWKKLTTYENIFSAPEIVSKRRILEGEPGYGKSTVTLQFAYDWCNPKPTSPLKDVEILILLRLRQLGGVPSIYEAIKRFILPKDTKIGVSDIRNILGTCKSVVVILDGYDEYPDQHSSSINDVMFIIARQMFADFDVLITTRSSLLPKKYPPSTKRVRLTGFNEAARRYYIRKAVVGDNDEEVRKVQRYLQENPILSGLCQVPLLFVIFAHMTHESEDFRNLNSVTSFFRYMISCFHSHMRNKMNDENVQKYELFESNHTHLDKIAFEAFSGKSQKIAWEKDKICQLVGQQFYEQYKRIGILVEEEVCHVIDDPKTLISEHVRFKKEVRFYHKLFCEWYAAHYLEYYLGQHPNLNLADFLRNLNPVDVQYLYRFACGLNSKCAEKIIQYLQSMEGGDKFAILCILEQTGKIANIKDNIRALCEDGVVISGNDSHLLQLSSIQLLEIAARNDIFVRGVCLYNCFQSIDLTAATIKTTSGLILSAKIPMKELAVHMYHKEITEDELYAMLRVTLMNPSIKILKFGGSVPPESVEITSTLSDLHSRGVKVRWNLFKGRQGYMLNLQTGRWQGKLDGKEPTTGDFEEMRAKFQQTLLKRTEDRHRKSVEKRREELREKTEQRSKASEN